LNTGEPGAGKLARPVRRGAVGKGLRQWDLVGGLPYFFQPQELAALLRALKRRGVHTVVYTGYTLEPLARRGEPAVHEALRLTDLLIDGPFVRSLMADAGRWRGSRNQRIILQPARTLAACDAYPRSAHP
jgi:anaerobic ribonucleoside-triphosphate reductase activating protein